MLLCYITDRKQFPGDEREQQLRLLEKISECAAATVDFIQLREKDLNTRALQELARKAADAVLRGSPTRLLINSRTDVALACGAHGVHLPARDLSASEARAIWDRAGLGPALVGVSTHSLEEVVRGEAHGADFALFGPVFEKDGEGHPRGLDELRHACQRPHVSAATMPVLALGGVTLENAQLCLDAGAAGIAGIRLFQENDVERVVSGLRALRV
jgi:thiamine-phosphate pyrophosphorylase